MALRNGSGDGKENEPRTFKAWAIKKYDDAIKTDPKAPLATVEKMGRIAKRDENMPEHGSFADYLGYLKKKRAPQKVVKGMKEVYARFQEAMNAENQGVGEAEIKSDIISAGGATSPPSPRPPL